MEQIKEGNKNLIALRNNYFTMLFLVSGGVAGLLPANITNIKGNLLIIFGIYLTIVCISKIQTLNSTIKTNIKRLIK